ncbi:uncharacterized protein LOC134706165 [Mytilus trossulus]|uniref:uncharacterized protein LOC134706165 n=1 Tax=Mytilus trossulus TaxID=6551 RepID=UPI00300642E6
MASALLEKKAQLPVTCQLCDEETKINWKCIECDSLLCDRCKSIHSKVKTQLEHSVINLKDIGQQDTYRKPEARLKVIRCETHEQQTYCVYCRDCEQLACPVCLSQNHKKHDLEEIRTIVEEKMKEMKDYEQKYITIILKKDEYNDFILDKAVLIHEERYEDTKNKVKDYEQFMKNEVTKHIHELLVDLDDRLKTTKLSISQEKTKLDERKSQMNEKIREIRECEKKTDIKAILKIADSAEKYFQKLTEEEITIPLSSSMFDEGIFPESVKTMILGSIQEEYIPKQDVTNEIKLEVVKVYKTDVYEIFSLDPSNDGSFFLYCKSDVRNVLTDTLVNIHQLDTKKDRIRNNFTRKLSSDGLAILPNGTLLSPSIKEHKIFVLSKFGRQVREFKNMAPKAPGALHITADHHILIGTIEADGEHQLEKWTMDGEVLKVFRFDNLKRKLFELIVKLNTDSHGNIFVVDFEYDSSRGRIIKLNNEGQRMWVYDGHPKINSYYRTFLPTDILNICLNSWITYDRNTHTIHVLSSNGKLQNYFNVKELNIESSILSMAISKDGHVIFGEGVTQEEMISRSKKAKLYVLKLKEC